MTENPGDEGLSDSDIQSTGGTTAGMTDGGGDADGTDTSDADGTDGTDTGDADGTDGIDSDSTESDGGLGS